MRLDFLSTPQSGGKNVKMFRWDHRLQRQKALHGIQTGFPMVVTLAIGEYNPFKCHEDVLSLQPMIPPKRFDIFPPAFYCCWYK